MALDGLLISSGATSRGSLGASAPIFNLSLRFSVFRQFSIQTEKKPSSAAPGIYHPPSLWGDSLRGGNKQFSKHIFRLESLSAKNQTITVSGWIFGPEIAKHIFRLEFLSFDGPGQPTDLRTEPRSLRPRRTPFFPVAASQAGLTKTRELFSKHPAQVSGSVSVWGGQWGVPFEPPFAEMNMLYFPCWFKVGIYHYWKYVPGVLTKWKFEPLAQIPGQTCLCLPGLFLELELISLLNIFVFTICSSGRKHKCKLRFSKACPHRKTLLLLARV